MDAIGDIVGLVLLVGFVGLVVTLGTILLILPIVALIYTMTDIFHREDLGAGKLVWSLIVLLVPLIGLAAYWLSRPAYESTPRTLMPQRPAMAPETREAPAVEQPREPAARRQAA
ncbi:MAG TPA: PLDc N-terminal domain-containing protein [Dehalococcoidia bacterium]|jgi:hypothetical protein|nr:PLDc N-terminal domain-containing protein [Dehalococcoidia bacterium]